VRATTIRRLIVFGVCALGVSGLYLVPSVALPPEHVGYPSADDNPTVRPGAAPTVAAHTPAAHAAAGDTRSTRPADEPIEAATGIEQTASGQPAGQQQRRRDGSGKRAGATAFDAADSPDNTPPEPVSGISFGPVSKDTLTVSWAPAHDDVSVIGYRIWLNGFEVATTAETHVTVNWFNDDMGPHVVQIRALDAAGNESKTSPNALVNRPTAARVRTPSPMPTESTPTGSTQPSESPTDQANGRPSASQSATGVR
jgi:hypothetical protein